MTNAVFILAPFRLAGKTWSIQLLLNSETLSNIGFNIVLLVVSNIDIFWNFLAVCASIKQTRTNASFQRPTASDARRRVLRFLAEKAACRDPTRTVQ